jgi:pheromone shutdown protein TraB
MDVITVGEARVVLLAAVRGLVQEGERVRRAVEEVNPDAVAITVGREDLESLRTYDGAEHPPSNWEEEMYVAGLEAWGAVRKPPPCFVEAVRAAQERDIPVRALDFNDEDYTEVYVTRIDAMDLLFHTRLEKKIRKHRFTSTTPEDFVVEFDRVVNDPEAYARLEEERERHIARRIAKLAGRHRSLLAVVEHERAAGVRKRLGD